MYATLCIRVSAEVFIHGEAHWEGAINSLTRWYHNSGKTTSPKGCLQALKPPLPGFDIAWLFR